MKSHTDEPPTKKWLTTRNYILVVLLIIVSFIISIRLQPDSNTNNLTTPPVKSISEKSTETSTSIFSLSINTPLLDANKHSNQIEIKEINGIDDGPTECSKNRNSKISCYTTKYQYTIASGSPSIIPGIDNTISVSIPVYVSGKGTQTGRAEGKPQSDIRYFQSKLVASANINISLDSKWCPKINIEPDFLWKGPSKVDVFHRATVDLQYLVAKQLRDPVIDMGNAIVKDFISCEKIRGLLSNSWNQVSFPINQRGSTIQRYINIKPETIGYAGLTLSAGKLYLDYRISALTEITDNKLAVKHRELPAVTLAADSINTAYISLPVSLSYQEILNEVHKQLGGEPFLTRNRFGEHKIQIKKINIYPSDGNLIIGLQLYMTNTEDWFGKTGWVHIITKPELIDTGDGITLSQAKFAEAVDPDAWVTIRRALKESILQTIEERELVIGFNESAKRLLKTMMDKLEKPRSDFPVQFANPAFKISNISLLDNSLVINGELGAEASFVPEEELEIYAQNDALPTKSEIPPDPALEGVHLQINTLLHQIDDLENKLNQYREILNN